MKSQNHTSVNCAVKVPGVSRGQNGPNANKNNTTTPVAHGPAHKPAAHGPTTPYVGITTNKNSEPVRIHFS